MTLTPCDLAFASIAAPEPESRFDEQQDLRAVGDRLLGLLLLRGLVALRRSGSRLARRAAVERLLAAAAGRRVSQRTDDFVSGSSTATFWALPPESVLLVLPPPLDELSSLPQPANTAPPSQGR